MQAPGVQLCYKQKISPECGGAGAPNPPKNEKAPTRPHNSHKSKSLWEQPKAKPNIEVRAREKNDDFLFQPPARAPPMSIF